MFQTDSPPELPPYSIRIDAKGRWFCHDALIEDKTAVCFLSHLLQRNDDGSFHLLFPNGYATGIMVEDAPFIALCMRWCGSEKEQKISFRLNNEAVLTAGPENPLRSEELPDKEEPTLYLTVRYTDNNLPLEAKICRAVYWQLEALSVVEEINDGLFSGLWSKGVFFPIRRIIKPPRKKTIFDMLFS